MSNMLKVFNILIIIVAILHSIMVYRKRMGSAHHVNPVQESFSSAPQSRMPIINDQGPNTGTNAYYNECPSAVSFPSPGCALEDPLGDVIMSVGHYAAVGGTPREANMLGQYAPGSIERKANGGSNVNFRRFGEFDCKGPRAPGVTLTRC